MSKYRYLISYSGLAVTAAYIIFAINVAGEDLQNIRSGCIISCFNQLRTLVVTFPGLLLISPFYSVNLSELDWTEISIAIGLTALLLYMVITGLEKLVCYLINFFRRSNIPK